MEDASLPIEAVHEVRDSCLCLATQRAARVLARRFDRLFAPLGITNGQFSLMVALSGRWSPRMGELAGFLAMDHATMTAAARKLEAKGLLTLEPDESDARARRPVLTAEGRRKVAEAMPLWRDEHRRLQEQLAADAAMLARALGQIREA
jgi:DNA-binding MarR family transcriptional regulator